MEKLISLLGGVALAGLIAVIPPLFIVLYVLFGAFGGWVVSWFFGDMIIVTLTRFGFDAAGVTMWQLGGTLAFVGAFFKASTTVNKK